MAPDDEARSARLATLPRGLSPASNIRAALVWCASLRPSKRADARQDLSCRQRWFFIGSALARFERKGSQKAMTIGKQEVTVRIRLAVVALVLAVSMTVLAVSPGEAQAAVKCKTHWHKGKTVTHWGRIHKHKSGRRHWHPTFSHWHKGKKHRHCWKVRRSYSPGAYNAHLAKKYAKIRRPGRGYTRSEFNSLLRKAGWPRRHWSKVYRVATCESGRRWSTGRGSFVGLMQHRPGNGGMSRRQLENPVLNLMVARWMYKSRGWQPWPVCGRR